MLEVIRDYFGLSPDRMLFEIQGMREQVARVLKSKGVNYDDLRAALVPDREKLEIALIFDTMKIEDSWYGYQVFERIIPLLDPRTKNSVLVGDYIGESARFSSDHFADDEPFFAKTTGSCVLLIGS